jgi:hypothetical protein
MQVNQEMTLEGLPVPAMFSPGWRIADPDADI